MIRLSNRLNLQMQMKHGLRASHFMYHLGRSVSIRLLIHFFLRGKSGTHRQDMERMTRTASCPTTEGSSYRSVRLGPDPSDPSSRPAWDDGAGEAAFWVSQLMPLRAEHHAKESLSSPSSWCMLFVLTREGAPLASSRSGKRPASCASICSSPGRDPRCRRRRR